MAAVRTFYSFRWSDLGLQHPCKVIFICICLVSHPTGIHRHLHSCVYVHAYTYLHLKSLNIFFKRCFSILLTLGWTSDLLCPSECSGNDYLWIVSSFMLSWRALFLGDMRESHFNFWNMRSHKVNGTKADTFQYYLPEEWLRIASYSRKPTVPWWEVQQAQGTAQWQSVCWGKPWAQFSVLPPKTNKQNKWTTWISVHYILQNTYVE